MNQKALYIVVLFITLCIIYPAMAVEEVRKTYYPNGKLKFEWHYKDGKREGISRLYFEGNVLAESLEESKIKAEAHFKNGKLDGTTREYFESGVLKEEAHFKDGKPHGITRLYTENGLLQYEWTYENGKLIRRKRYDSQGNLEAEDKYSKSE